VSSIRILGDEFEYLYQDILVLSLHSHIFGHFVSMPLEAASSIALRTSNSQ
jgi:hypothetical protein